jgi:transketolase
MRNAFVSALSELAQQNPRLFLITGDLGYNVLDSFKSEYPHQFINAGVSEQSMTSVASGMALEGKTVFTYSIGNFPTFRCLEQIRNNVCYHNLNVKIVSIGAGLAYGSAGMSHHTTEDIAIIRALPEMTVFSPCDPEEARQITYLAATICGPFYIRLGKGGERSLHSRTFTAEVGKALILKEGGDTAIFATGAIAEEALMAAEMLLRDGIDCAVYSFPTVKPIDKDTVLRVSGDMKVVYSLEEHSIVGGLGSAVSEVMAEEWINTKLIRIGIRDQYIRVAGSQSYLRELHGLDRNSIYLRIKTDQMHTETKTNN